MANRENGKRHKEHVDRKEEPTDRPDQGISNNRRAFIGKMARAGGLAGLAHFLIVGGKLQKVLASADNCTTYPWQSPQDACYPTRDNNPDVCVLQYNPPTAEVGDECAPSKGDTDQCHVERSVNPAYELGDECGSVDADDLCELNQVGATFDLGDACPGGVNVMQGGPDHCWNNLYGDVPEG